MHWLSSGHLQHYFHLWLLGGLEFVIGLESMGLPLRGEAVLVFAALYAGGHEALSF